MKEKSVKRPAIFGEVLFDVFPDGEEILGGAPFNVAWNLKGFGVSPLFITAIGADARGKKVLSAMEKWGMDLSGVQERKERPTGKVEIKKTADGGHSFSIPPEQAYDYIYRGGAEKLIAKGSFAFFYHGSLAARSSKSRWTLDHILNYYRIPRFVDVNLREPWFAAEAVNRDILGAECVKLNDSELETLSGKSAVGETKTIASAKEFRKKFGIKNLIVTMGEKGAVIAAPNSSMFFKPKGAKDVKDTVGAGDAFSSVVILGMMLKWPYRTYMARAVEFAASVCGLQGAVTESPEFYSEYASKWSL